VPTGVKHLHHAAERYDIGVYFEANGHGTVLFSPETIDILAKYQPSTPAQDTAATQLRGLISLINQAVGDAISDFLLVEVILAHRRWVAEEWDAGYEDLPNRLLKVNVPDRTAFKTEDAERRLTSPANMQVELDSLVRKFEKGRSFVRPSGTEDCVRVYAEASTEPGAIREYGLQFFDVRSRLKNSYGCNRTWQSGTRLGRAIFASFVITTRDDDVDIQHLTLVISYGDR